MLLEPRVQEGLFLFHEKENKHNKRAMAVDWDKELLVIVGHLPRGIAEICYFFTKHDGQIIGRVMGCQVHEYLREVLYFG